MTSQSQEQCYTFSVYPPASPGLPWLSVCIGPTGQVLAAEAFSTRAAAQARTIECAQAFVTEVECPDAAHPRQRSGRQH